MCDQVCDVSSPGTDISEEFACVSDAVNYSEIYNQQIEDVRHADRNERTRMPGVFLYRIANFDYPLVRVELSTYSETHPNPTIGTLAEALKLERRSLFSRILSWYNGPNGFVREYLYRRYVGGDATSVEDQTAALRAVMNGDADAGTPRYHRWRLPVGRNYRLILPRTEALEQEIALNRTALVSANMQQLSSSLLTEVDNALAKAERIAANQQALGRILQPYQQELGSLGLLIEFVDIAEVNPASGYSSTQQSNIDTLQRKLNSLKDYAERTLGREPTTRARSLQGAIRRDSDSLYQMLEGDSRLYELLAQACQSDDMITSRFMQGVYSKLGACYRVVLTSSHAVTFITGRLQPALEMIDRGEWRSFASSSCLGTVAAKISLVPTIAGNLPGPPSLLMGVLEASMAKIIQIASENHSTGLIMRNLSVRVTAKLIGLSGPDKNEFILRMSSTDPEEVIGVKGWSERVVNSNVMSSPGWGVFMSLITGILFLNAFVTAATTTTDSMITRIRLWGDTAAQFTGFASSLIQALQRFKFVSQGRLGTAAVGRTLGFFGSLAAIASSSAMMAEEHRTRDYAGMTVAGIGLASGLLSLFGFMLWMSAGTAAVPPAAAVLFVAALIVGLIGAIVGYFTSDTNGEALVEGLVEHLGGANLFAAQLRGDRSLNSLFEEVRHYHHNVTIKDLSRDARNALNYLFGLNQITDTAKREQTEELINALIA
ncbi:hypothetical protein EH243_00060 [Amphritea opalescens]|uniref:Uncharacterized protein n=1 Tax=Amphritea opalescens TaxID=2490544 RepID=A0A430KVK2_9GAMM|nr:hypothetical protein [Amphritea opalescens]RTE67384.1 hypothetical protein EH243_00060 [Amphritea opalescens]